jgi:WD40 repeat protein
MNPSDQEPGLDEALMASLLEEIEQGRSIDVNAWSKGDPALRSQVTSAIDVISRMLHPRVVPSQHGSVDRARSMEGRTIGDYRVLEELGRGGMAVVYRGHQISMDRPVALKFIPAQATLFPRTLERFEREAQTAGRLVHPNLVTVYELVRAEGFAFISMELIEGVGLDRVIADPESHGFREPNEDRFRSAAQLGVRLADAIDYAHSHGVVHRDIKPANVLISAAGEAKVADFGVCGLLESEELTAAGTVLGTPAYMAPEQLEGHADGQSDIYALGATLYEVVTGKRPFDGESNVAMHHQIGRPPARPRALRADTPKALEAIIIKAMAPLPQHRYGTAGALRRDLEAFLDRRPVSATSPKASTYFLLMVRRNRAASMIAAAAAAALLVLGVSYVIDSQRARERDLRNAYATSLGAALAAHEAREPVLARRYLEGAPAKNRGWEWGHLDALTGSELWYQALDTPHARAIACSTDHAWIVVAGSQDLFAFHREQPSKIWKRPIGQVMKIHFNEASKSFYFVSASGIGYCLKVGDSAASLPEMTVEQDLGPETCRSKPRTTVVSADGSVVLMGSYDGSVRRYGPDWKPLGAPTSGHSSRVYDFGFLSGTHEFISVGMDQTLRRWSADGSQRHIIWTNDACFYALDVHPTKPLVALVDDDATLTIYDLENERVVQQWTSSSYRLMSDVKFIRGGDAVMVSVGYNLLLTYEIGYSMAVRRTNLTRGALREVVVDDARGRVIGASLGGAVREWSTRSDGGYLSWQGHVFNATCILEGRSEARIVSGGSDASVCLWDSFSGRLLRVFEGLTDSVSSVAVTVDGTRLAAVDRGGRLALWDVESGRRLKTTEVPTAERAHVIDQIDFSADGSQLFLRGAADEASVLSGETLLPRPPRTHPLEPTARWRFRRDARAAAFWTDEEAVLVQLNESGQPEGETHTLPLDGIHLTRMAFRPGSQELFGVTSEGNVHVWSELSGAQLRVRPLLAEIKKDQRITGLEFVADGTRALLATNYVSPLLFDADSLHGLLNLTHGSQITRAIASIRDGAALASVSSSGVIRVWDDLDVLEREVKTQQLLQAGGDEAYGAEGTSAFQDFLSPASVLSRGREVLVHPGPRPGWSEADRIRRARVLVSELTKYRRSIPGSYLALLRLEVANQSPRARLRLEQYVAGGAEPRAEALMALACLNLKEGQPVAHLLQQIRALGAAEVQAGLGAFSPADVAVLRSHGVSGQ